MRNSNFVEAFQGLAVLIGALVLVQAILAGQLLFKHPGMKDAHGGLGNLVVIVAVVMFVIGWFLKDRGRFRLLYLAGAIMVLSIVQWSLGELGKDNDNWASLHVPLGVLLFGVSTVSALLVFLEDWDASPASPA